MGRVARSLGHPVLLIDADPDMNLATLLEIPAERSITPIVEMKELIAERTGTNVGQPAPFFTMNPKVDDVPERFWVEQQGIRLLVMGTITTGGGGCACPENAFLKSLLGHSMVNLKDWVILDMEAGIEHLGRGTAIGVDAMVVVVEPSRTSIETAHRIRKLAGDIGIRRIAVAGNKVQSAEEERFIRDNTDGLELLGFLSYSEAIRGINTGRSSVLTLDGEPLAQAEELVRRLGAK